LNLYVFTTGESMYFMKENPKRIEL